MIPGHAASGEFVELDPPAGSSTRGAGSPAQVARTPFLPARRRSRSSSFPPARARPSASPTVACRAKRRWSRTRTAGITTSSGSSSRRAAMIRVPTLAHRADVMPARESRASVEGRSDALPDDAGDCLRDPLRIPAHPMHHRRGRRVEEGESQEIEPWLAWHDAALVPGLVLVEDRQVDPGVIRIEARAPHDVRDLENATVLEERQPVPNADRPRNTLHPRGGEILGLRPDEGHAVGQHLRTHLPAQRRLHRQHAGRKAPRSTRSASSVARPALDAERTCPVPCRTPGRMVTCQLERDLGRRVAGLPRPARRPREAERSSGARRNQPRRRPSRVLPRTLGVGAAASSSIAPPRWWHGTAVRPTRRYQVGRRSSRALVHPGAGSDGELEAPPRRPARCRPSRPSWETSGRAAEKGHPVALRCGGQV